MIKKLHTKLNEFIEQNSNLELLVEMARINDLHDFSSSNITVYVFGGMGYRTEHGLPHFTVFLDKNKKQNINILIPEIDEPLNDLKILVAFDKQDWNTRAWLRKELIEWLKRINTFEPDRTNLQKIISEWNTLNRDNPSVKQMKFI
jgi:hypothetical protein